MPKIVLKCPSCGAQEPWQRNDTFRCANCGTEWREESRRKEVPVEPHEQPKDTHEVVKPRAESPTAATTQSSLFGEIGCLIFIVVVVIMFAVAAGTGMVEEWSRRVEIDTFGHYTVKTINCQDSPVVVEFGFQGEEPILTVYPGREGKDRWKVSAEMQQTIKARTLGSLAYLLIHCEGKKEPSVFASGHIPLPEDGVQVVLRER